MWGREETFFRKFPSPPTPPPLPSKIFDFIESLIRAFSFVGTVLICLNARLVCLALIPPNAVNVTGILKSRGIDARRTRHKSHAQPCLCLYGNIPKDEHEKSSGSVYENAEKRCRKSPQRPFFPLEKELPEKNVTIFLFGFCFLILCTSRFFFHNKNIFQLCILLIFTKNYVITIK